jgi:hypothetical protein
MIDFADADAVRLAHIIEFFGLLGGGQKDAGLNALEDLQTSSPILPGRTHYNISSNATLATVVPPFLDAPMPGAK